nr:IS2 protein [Escherichia coli]
MELCLIPVRTIRWLECYQDLSGVGVVHRRKNCHYSADYGPGMTVSHVARLHGINANQIFKWRKQY